MERDFDTESRSEKLWNTPALENKPMRPPRRGIVGEQVFAELWEQMMADTETTMLPPNGRLSRILGAYPFDLEQRCATVAASLVVWFGTNCGRAFLYEANKHAANGLNKGDSYLRTWAVENSRKSYSSNGARTLEMCLQAEGSKDLPELSGRDYEVAEHVVFWLAEDEGQDFLQRCEAEIAARKPEADLMHHLEHHLQLPAHSVKRVLELARKIPPPSPTGAD